MGDILGTPSTSGKDVEQPEARTHSKQDVCHYEEKIIQDTAAVMGASDNKICSYDSGYLKRQQLYSCLTCIPESKNDPEKSAGICLACSQHCHDGHELVQVYTKRNFRCDCGNQKFNGFKCTLCSSKSDYNEENKYNQNFGGIYCVCHRPYPDPQDSTPDRMIQCIICEDWYHCRHLGTEIPSEPFAEMICEICVKKHNFLLAYDGLKKDESSSSEKEACRKPQNKSDTAGTLFFKSITWRKELCTCDQCLELYKNESISFLIELEDSVLFSENKDQSKAREDLEADNKHLINSLDRAQLVEVVDSYNNLEKNLKEYLQKFSKNNKVVREEDIDEFFNGLAPRKKRKVSE